MDENRQPLSDNNRRVHVGAPPAKVPRFGAGDSARSRWTKTDPAAQAARIEDLTTKIEARENHIRILRQKFADLEESHRQELQSVMMKCSEKARSVEEAITVLQVQHKHEMSDLEGRHAELTKVHTQLTTDSSVARVRLEAEVDKWKRGYEQLKETKSEKVATLSEAMASKERVIKELQDEMKSLVAAKLAAESSVSSMRKAAECAAALEADIVQLRAQKEAETKRARDAEESLAAQRSDARHGAQQAAHEREMRESVSAELSRAREEIVQLQSQLSAAAVAKDTHSAEAQDMQKMVGELRVEVARHQALCDSLKRELGLEKERVQCEAEECETLKGQLKAVTAEAAAAREELNALRSTSLKDVAEKSCELTSLRSKLASYEAQLSTHAAERRRLHNEVMELKGNIRVYCRVRPGGAIGAGQVDAGGKPLAVRGDKLDHFSFPDKLSDQRTVVVGGITRADVTGKASAVSYPPFVFDRVYTPSSSQSEVFDDISRLVQSALDGYRVCIFAYGQTGSGKTYTMEGPNGTSAAAPSLLDRGDTVMTVGGKGADDKAGMIPRSVDQVFEYAQSLQASGWRFEISARFLEIYNDSIRDLISDGVDDGGHHEIQVSKDGTHTVTGVNVVRVDTPRRVLELLNKARKNRATAATNMNERSSRSHSVFTLSLKGSHPESHTTTHGVLNLVDLAGSERVDQSGASGERFQEAVSINSSLSLLARVIQQLGEKTAAAAVNRRGTSHHHISYRDCKLTHLLQPCLGKDCKVLMFVNIAPEGDSVSESVNSLRFASKVNGVSVGQATRCAKEG